MIYQHQDTKSLEKFINCKATSSLSNPFTDSVNGYKLHKSAVCYHGYRSLLEKNNILRFHTGRISKATTNYFVSKNGGPDCTTSDLENVKIQILAVGNKNKKKIIEEYLNQTQNKSKIIMKSPSSYYLWNHPKYPVTNYLDSLWIANYDQRENTYERISHKTYLNRVKNAIQNKTNDKEENNKKKEKDFSYEGVHGSCVFSNLDSFHFRNFIWDAFHSISNVIKYYMELMSGDRKINTKWRKVCVLQSIFPKLHFNTSNPDWAVSLQDQLIFDTVLNSVLIPSGVFIAKNDYAIKYAFRHFSYLKGHDRIVLLTVYFKYMVSFFDNMPKAYKNYFSQFADDIIDMLNPIIDISKHETMCAKLQETLALHDCLFPDSEKPFCLMQLLDIVHFLKRGGPIRSHWCLFGERALGKISISLPKGGSNYLKTLFNRYTAKENSIADLFITEKITESNIGINFRTNFDVDLYSLRLLKTSNFFKNNDFLENYKDDLFLAVVNFLNTECISDVIMKSDLYRLRYVYDSNSKFKTMTFSKWVDYLNNNFVSFSASCFILKDFGINITDRSSKKKAIEIVDWASSGGIYKEDFKGIIKDIFDFKNPMIIDRAIVKGNNNYLIKITSSF
jgi:hypothetical protein